MSASREEPTPRSVHGLFAPADDALASFLVNTHMNTHAEGSLLSDTFRILDLLQKKTDAVKSERDLPMPRHGDKQFEQYRRVRVTSILITETDMSEPRFYAASELVKYTVEKLYGRGDQLHVSLSTGTDRLVISAEHPRHTLVAQSGDHQKLPAPISLVRFSEAKFQLAVSLNAMFADWKSEDAAQPSALTKRFTTLQHCLDCNNQLLCLIDACKEIDPENIIYYKSNVAEKTLHIDKVLLDRAKHLLLNGAAPQNQYRL